MAKIDEKALEIARVYARSLLALASEAGAADAVLSELSEISALVDLSPAFARLVADPFLGSAETAGAIEKLFRGKASDLTVDALQVLRTKGRLALIPALAETYRQELQTAQGFVEVQVTTAVALSAELKGRLARAVDQHTGKKSRLLETVDPNILGGLVVKIGDEKIDSSVARELSKLSEALLARASKEILSGRAYSAEEAR